MEVGSMGIIREEKVCGGGAPWDEMRVGIHGVHLMGGQVSQRSYGHHMGHFLPPPILTGAGEGVGGRDVRVLGRGVA